MTEETEQEQGHPELSLADSLLHALRAHLAEIDAAMESGDAEGVFRAAISVAMKASDLDQHLSSGLVGLPSAWMRAVGVRGPFPVVRRTSDGRWEKT